VIAGLCLVAPISASHAPCYRPSRESDPRQRLIYFDSLRGFTRIKSILIGTVARLVLAGSVVGTAHAATSTVPFITGVSIKMVTPGTLTKSGALAGSLRWLVRPGGFEPPAF
jgi:hypothetical protein